MSFIKETFIGVQCDNCREFFENTDGASFFVDKNSARDEATSWGEFFEHKGNHYCRQCAKTDDDDKLIIDISRKKEGKNISSDSEMLDWLQGIMTPKGNYCEVFFAGLRDGNNDAIDFQIECNPEKFKVLQGKNIREAILLAMSEYDI